MFRVCPRILLCRNMMQNTGLVGTMRASEYDIPKSARAVMWQKEAIPGVQEAVVMAGQEIHRA